MKEYCVVGHFPLIKDASIYRYKDVEKGFTRTEGTYVRTISTNMKTIGKFDEYKPESLKYSPTLVVGFHSIEEAKFFILKVRVEAYPNLIETIGLTGLVKDISIQGEYIKTKKLYDIKKLDYPEYFV